METRANFVLIGSFTLAVIAAAFGFVLWFQSLHTTKARSPMRIGLRALVVWRLWNQSTKPNAAAITASVNDPIRT